MLQGSSLSWGPVSCPLITQCLLRVLDLPSVCSFQLETQMRSDEILPCLFLDSFSSCATVKCLLKKKGWSKRALSQLCHNLFLFFLALLPRTDSQDSSVFLLSFRKSCWFYKPQLLQSTFPFPKSTLSQGLLCILLELPFPAIPHSSQRVLSYRKILFPLLNIPHLIVILTGQSCPINLAVELGESSLKYCRNQWQCFCSRLAGNRQPPREPGWAINLFKDIMRHC